MKLIDILARELKVWPDDSWAAVGQAHNGSLHENNALAHKLKWTEEHYSWASDWVGAIVTRGQWQAAVGALAAQDMHDTAVNAQDRDGFYGCESVSADFNYATLTASACDAHCKVVRKAWDGEGDPAVGSLAEDHSIPGAPVYMVEVVATEGGLVAIKRPGFLKVVDLSCLRPIRTAERVEENKMRATISSMENLWREGGFEAIYKAGYRKP